MNKMTFTAAGACSALLAAGHAPAQNYPTKTVRIIVPYPAGGTSDILSRLLGPKLNEVFGQPVVVDNRPGANGRPRAVNRIPACGMRTSASRDARRRI